jgi:hypothetical protein
VSLEFIDGFDHYISAAQAALKWSSVFGGTSGQGGKFSGSSYELDNNAQNLTMTGMANQQTRTIGFNVRLTSGMGSGTTGPGILLAGLYDGATLQVQLGFLGNGALVVSRGGTVVLGTTAVNAVSLSNWYYVELRVTIGSTVGSFDLYVDGLLILSATGVNTQASTNAYSNSVAFWGNNPAFVYIDDVYILNSLGIVNNGPLGPIRVLTALPTGDSAVNHSWTPLTAGPHYKMVYDPSNPGPDGDTTYNYSSTVGQIDTYTGWPDPAPVPANTTTPSGVIAGVQTVLDGRLDTGANQISEECRDSTGVNHDGANTFSLTSSYAMYRQVRETDPGTAAAWTAANLNASEFGVKLVS